MDGIVAHRWNKDSVSYTETDGEKTETITSTGGDVLNYYEVTFKVEKETESGKRRNRNQLYYKVL